MKDQAKLKKVGKRDADRRRHSGTRRPSAELDRCASTRRRPANGPIINGGGTAMRVNNVARREPRRLFRRPVPTSARVQGENDKVHPLELANAIADPKNLRPRASSSIESGIITGRGLCT